RRSTGTLDVAALPGVGAPDAGREAAAFRAVREAAACLPVVRAGRTAAVPPRDAQNGVRRVGGTEQGEHVSLGIRLRFEDGRQQTALGRERGREGSDARWKPYADRRRR